MSSLETGGWFNRSPLWLRIGAVATALGFLAFCAATLYYVAQFFVCIGDCGAHQAPFALLAVSAMLGLVPAIGTGGIGYFIVRGLMEDANREAR